MTSRCPGSDNMRTPTLAVSRCPACGGEVEVFSSDAMIKCAACGWSSENSMQSCYNWCRYAKECREEGRKR
ncbi:MAG TPA: hypothetical protein VLX68_11605 [Chitinivibrionales bacterium]|nr:hypothetical protein [Chitinivibrionales bacterium]